MIGFENTESNAFSEEFRYTNVLYFVVVRILDLILTGKYD